eukprot:TRINITY_DN38855_c0_g1_i1.p1 TRINITY_DN38855_c0_g1~~TRINITY_DN38855_c0_g1_i1.p1  ORF type:complete len:290 (-),score=11.11 TRINITY_DN38855_c0_g1_i1:315-1079(-)
MIEMRLILGFSLLENAITISVVATLNRFSLAILVGPLVLASVCRTLAAVAHFCIERREIYVAGSCALSVAVLLYFSLLARNSWQLWNGQNHVVDEALAIKAAILFASAWCSAVATSLLLYKVLRPLRRSVVDNEKDKATMLSLEDVTLRTFVMERVRPLANDVDGDLAHSDSCCVCLDAFVCGAVICELVCHHKFHRDCIESWTHSLNCRENSALCPLRCDLSSNDAMTTHHAAVAEVAALVTRVVPSESFRNE